MTIEKEQLDKQNSSLEPEALKELKIHQEAVKDSTPLSIVREKEVELKKYLIEMQIQADKILENARKEAQQNIEKMAAAGKKKAEEHYKHELAKIMKKAESIKNEAPEKAKVVAQKGLQNLEKALDQLKGILLPGASR